MYKSAALQFDSISAAMVIAKLQPQKRKRN
jgi:hypothetical protein